MRSDVLLFIFGAVAAPLALALLVIGVTGLALTVRDWRNADSEDVPDGH